MNTYREILYSDSAKDVATAWRDLAVELDGKANNLERLRLAIKAIILEYDLLERKTEELRDECSENRETIASLQDRVDDLRHVELKKATERLDEATATIAQLKNDVVERDIRIESLREQVDDLRNILKAVGKEG